MSIHVISQRSALRRFMLTFLTGVVSLAGLACQGSDRLSAVVPEADADSLYWSIELNHHAITLSTQAPWNVMQLSITPYTYRKVALPLDSASITYVSSDSNAVSVTSDGQVRAKSVTSGVRIISTMTRAGVTYRDTAFVKAMNTSAPPVMRSFSIQPSPTDSAKIAAGNPFSISQYLAIPDMSGRQMTEALVYYRSEDPLITPVNRESGDLGTQQKLGIVKVVASAYVFGVSGSDTIMLTVGYPLYGYADFSVRPRTDILGTEVFLRGGNLMTVGVGADVTFSNLTEDTVAVVFDDTTNIEVFVTTDMDTTVSRLLIPQNQGPLGHFDFFMYRRFLAPGEYVYRDSRHGIVGRIRVIDERLSAQTQFIR